MTSPASIQSNNGENTASLYRENSNRNPAAASKAVVLFPEIPDKPIKRSQKPHVASERTIRVELGKRVGNGQCVALTRSRGFAISGNAKAWLANAKLAGYVVGNVPQVGAAIVTTESSYGTNTGHVGVVEKIDNKFVYLIEQNYVRLTISHGKIPIDSPIIRGYIYTKES